MFNIVPEEQNKAMKIFYVSNFTAARYAIFFLNKDSPAIYECS